MKYTITIENDPTAKYPYRAFYKRPNDSYIVFSGETIEEAEKGLIELIKASKTAEATITKEIEIND